MMLTFRNPRWRLTSAILLLMAAAALTTLALPVGAGVAEAAGPVISTVSRSSSHIKLSWTGTDYTAGSDYFYDLEYRRRGDSGWQQPGNVYITSKSISNLRPSTTYEFRVRILYVTNEDSTEGELSTTHSESTKAAPPAPTATPTPVPPVYFTAEWPVFNFANVAPAAMDGEVVVRLRWSNVEGANAYRMVRRAAGETTSSVADGEIQFDAREYTETVAATGKSVEFQVQGVIEGGTSGATAVVGGRTITVAKNTQKYGPFSDTVALLLSAESADPFAARDDLPPDAEGIPPIREFFRTLGETVGVEVERVDGWAVLMWFIFSVGAAAVLMAGTSAATGGEFVDPLPMGMGMLAMGLLWGIGGPVYAGVPWQFALTPLALMVVSGVIMARTRRMIP